MSISKCPSIDVSHYPNGPKLSFDQSGIQKFQIPNSESQQSLMKDTIRQNVTKQLTRRRRSELKISFSRTTLLRTINKNQLVQKFKNLLFMRSYILSKANQYLLQEQISYSKVHSHIQSSIPFIIQGSTISMILIMWSLLVQVSTIWIAPFIISFMRQQDSNPFYMIVTFQVWFDSLIYLNSPLVVNGETLFNRQQKVVDYIKKRFPEDLLYCICLLWEFVDFDDSYIIDGLMCLIIIFLSFIKISRNYESYYEILYLKGQYHYAVDIFSLIIIIFSYAHIMACIWHFVGQITSHYGQCWLDYNDYIHSSMWERYNASFYWATMTMSTVGYGDITPTNQVELFTANILMIISSCMFGYSISQIGMILKSQYEVQQKYKKSLILMNVYMKNSLVDMQIQSRIRNYLKFMSETDSQENKDDINKIINDLPIGLRKELISDVQMNIIKKIKILNNQFSQNLLKHLSIQLQEFKFTPGDVIYHRNDKQDQSLYYIEQGEVQIYEEFSEKILQTLKAGNTFGEYQFFTAQETKTATKSKGFSKIYKIHRESIIELLEINSKDYQRFYHIKDNIIFSSNYQIIHKMCNYCKFYSHLNIQCPLLTYQPDIYQRIKKEQQQYSIQNRYQFVRNQEKINSLLLNNAIKESIEDYKANLSQMQPNGETKSFIQTNSLYPVQDTFIIDKKDNHCKVKFRQQNSNSKSRTGQRQKKLVIMLNQRTLYRDSDRQLKTESSEDQLSSLKQHSQISTNNHLFNDQSFVDEQFQKTNFDIDKLMNYFVYMPNGNITQAIRQYEKSQFRKHKTYQSEFPKLTALQTYTRRESSNELLP